MRRIIMWVSAMLLASAVGLWVAIPHASAAAINVTTTADVSADDGACSLREAFVAALLDTASGASAGECPAGTVQDQISLPAGTYVVGSELPVISARIIINGAGAASTVIDGDATGSVLRLNATGEATINDVTLTGGDDPIFGGAVDNNGGFLTVNNSILDNNNGSLGGGAIMSRGPAPTLTINDSTISNNTASNGGGINVNNGDATIRNTTISSNLVGNTGGGIFDNGSGLTIINSTISNNTAPTRGGGISVSGSSYATIVFSTITNNNAPEGSGIASPDTTTITTRVNASIIADNTGGNDLDITNGTQDSFESGSFNIIGTREATITAFGAATSDEIDQTNIGLDPLAYNAGGTTQTHSHTVGSPAFNHVTGTITAGTDQSTDQNGTSRPLGDAKDAGSYEAVDLCGATHIASDADSLSFGIHCYNAAVNPFTISVVATIPYGSPMPTIDNNVGATLTVDGGGHLINSLSEPNVLHIENGDVTIDNLNMTGSGAGIVNNDRLTLTDSTLENFFAGSSGGGFLNSGVATILDSVIRNNVAIDSGAGIANSGDLTIARTTIIGNSGSAASIGGGIRSNGTLTITDSTISNNTANNGGGLYLFGDATITNSTISGNTAESNGGGIYSEGTVDLIYSTVTDNTAAIEGSGIGSLSFGSTASRIAGSVIAENDNSFGALDVELVGGGPLDSFLSGKFNVMGTIDPATTAFGPTTSDLVEQVGVDLGPLAANGGSTETHALLTGSPAIDHVTGLITIAPAPDFDQRSISRPQGSGDDAGAFELVTGPPALCAGLAVTINMNTNGGNGTGTAGNDVILGTPGADTIHGMAGVDVICGDQGADTIRGGAGNDTIFGEGGGDTIRGGGGGDIIHGGDGADEILGQGGTDTIDGGPGRDSIDGQGAADTIAGGTGADTINGQNGGDTIDGDGQGDTLKGQTGPDTIRGGAGDDDLFGGDGGDTLYGGSGTDKCSGNTGPDSAEAATCETTPGVETLF